MKQIVWQIQKKIIKFSQTIYFRMPNIIFKTVSIILSSTQKGCCIAFEFRKQYKTSAINIFGVLSLRIRCQQPVSWKIRQASKAQTTSFFDYAWQTSKFLVWLEF